VEKAAAAPRRMAAARESIAAGAQSISSDVTLGFLLLVVRTCGETPLAGPRLRRRRRSPELSLLGSGSKAARGWGGQPWK
jgi:hypothetical protein